MCFIHGDKNRTNAQSHNSRSLLLSRSFSDGDVADPRLFPANAVGGQREAKYEMKFWFGRLASHDTKVYMSHDFHFFVTSVVSQPLTVRPIITPNLMSFDKNCRTEALWRIKVIVVLSFTTLAGLNLGHENDGNRPPLGRLIFDRHGFGGWWLRVHKTCDQDHL
jgi:hypothetical protein